MNMTGKAGIAVGLLVFILGTLPCCSTLFAKKPKEGGPGEAGWLTITSRPTGVTLFFDGRLRYTDNEHVLTTPATVRMSPGYYDLKLKLEGYQDWRDTVRISAGETTKVFVPLRSLWDEEHFKAQGDAVFTIGTVLAVAILAMSFFMRNVNFK